MQMSRPDEAIWRRPHIAKRSRAEAFVRPAMPAQSQPKSFARPPPLRKVEQRVMPRKAKPQPLHPWQTADPRALPKKWQVYGEKFQEAVLPSSESEEVLPASKKKKSRHRSAEQLRADRAKSRQKSKLHIPVIPGRTAAEVMSVMPATMHTYILLLRALVSFMVGLSQQALLPHKHITQKRTFRFLAAVAPDEILDDAIASFIDQSYWEGEAGGLGRKMLAALSWLLPRYQKEGAGRLPRAIRASQGAARRAPGVTRLPLPEPIIYAIGMLMAFFGMAEGDGVLPSFAFMICFHLYLRPGELMRLQWKHITPPTRATPLSAAVVLHPVEEAIPSKVREFDETLVIDEPWMLEALAHCFPAHVARGLEPVIGVRPERFLQLFHKAQAALRLHQNLGPQQLYVVRHSGASADWIGQRRQRQAIKDRGRWSSDSSLRRYQKGGRVAEQFARCSAAVQKFSMQCLKSLPLVLQGRVRPSRPPFPATSNSSSS